MTRHDDVLERVMSKIKRVRQPGDPPKETLVSFDEFECDLCKGVIQRRELTQCHYCGRWVCREQCWDRDSLSCTSCASVIKLAKDLGVEERGRDVAEPADSPAPGRGKGLLGRLAGGKRQH